MIRRRDNPHIIITQTAHGWLAGQFAAYWGNQRFQFPPLAEALLLAATVHDQGWAIWEQTPQINEQGQPIDFLEMPVSSHMKLWHDSIYGLETQNCYAALLVSMHAQFLVQGRLEREIDTAEDTTLLKNFIAAQSAWETQTINRLKDTPHFASACLPHNLEANMRLLQIFDWLSLVLCMNKLSESVVVDVPARTPNERIEIRLIPTGKQSLTVRPWPFREATFRVSVQTRHLPSAIFESNEALQTAWQTADIDNLTFTLSDKGR